MKRMLLAVVGVLLVASSAQAQTVKNPTTAVFTVSADHAVVTKYELGFFMSGAAEPVQVADLGTGAPAGESLTRPLPSFPIGVTYVAKVRAYAGAIASDWSAESNPFFRTPAPPSGLAVK